MRHSLRYATLVSVFALSAAACSAVGDNKTFGDGGGDSNWTSGPGQGAGGEDDVIGGNGGSTGSVTNPANCHSGPDDDFDEDGWTPANGDCNDCNAGVNPDAADIINAVDADGNPITPQDEDCDGTIDNAPICDAGVAMNTQDPKDAAKAVDLCPPLNPRATWGVQSAEWVRADGSPMTLSGGQAAQFHLGHGVLDKFGVNGPRAGSKMLVLSSGTARDKSQSGYSDPGGAAKSYGGPQPAGYPKESPSCGNATSGNVNDDTGVMLTIKAPSNAHGFSFDFNFFTYEWPGYVCDTYNDFFIANLSPAPAAHADGDISFDSLNNPISVNNGLLTVCGPPGSYGNQATKQFDCPNGTGELSGTGFEGHGATSWLSTQAPVEPGQVMKIRWTVYNSADHVLNSTTLIDNWKWVVAPGVDVGTAPVIK